MGTFKINGGKKLSGEIVPQGAKNEALQILCAVLLTDEEVVIDNIPDIRDVNKLIEILQDLGVAVKKTGASQMTFQADDVDLKALAAYHAWTRLFSRIIEPVLFICFVSSVFLNEKG